MAKPKFKQTSKDNLPNIGELPHKPHYEVRTASQSYSNIAAVLAGFAFAAVVLVVQTTPPVTTPNAGTYQDWATIAFLLAFAGCIVSAFVFATVTGEEILAPRSHTIALLAGLGFSISSNLVIFGLGALVKIFLSPTIFDFVLVCFPLIMSLSPLFVAFSAFDPLIGFENIPITSKDIIKVFIPGFMPLLVVLIVRYSVGGFTVDVASSVFSYIMGSALLLIAISAGSALITSSFANVRFRMNLLLSGVMLGIHSMLIGLLILML
jgi:hypothetical protein